MVLTAIFIGLIILLGRTPLGLIPLGFINVTILCIPVIVGTFLLGLKTGLVLGACFGLMSAFSAFGQSPSALAAALVAANPFLAIVMCFLPRLLVPVVSHTAYHAIMKRSARLTAALPVAAALGSLTNTVLYLSMMLLFYVLVGLDTPGVLAVIGGTGLIAGGSEAAVAAILVTPITVALLRVRKKTM
jgi:uncharacterized membrane protein